MTVSDAVATGLIRLAVGAGAVASGVRGLDTKSQSDDGVVPFSSCDLVVCAIIARSMESPNVYCPPKNHARAYIPSQ